MTEAVIQYKPLGLFPLRWKRYIPQKWEQLTPRQMHAVAKVIYGRLTDASLVKELLNIPMFVARKLPPFYVFSLVEHLDFLYEYKARNSFAIDKIGDGVCPEPRLEGMSFAQFIFVDSYFSELTETNNVQTLNKFIAALYIPQGQPFSEKTIKKRAGAMARENYYRKQAIVLNYRLVREWLHDSYPLVFQKITDDKENKPERKKTNTKKHSWVRVFEAIVGDDIANEEKYAEKPVHRILRFMQNKIKENARRKF